MERPVFKIFGSIGPAGAILSLHEKLMRVFFFEAYDLADPKKKFNDVFLADVRKLRESLVHELFSERGDIESCL
jgi:hypothetical protein